MLYIKFECTMKLKKIITNFYHGTQGLIAKPIIDDWYNNKV